MQDSLSPCWDPLAAARARFLISSPGCSRQTLGRFTSTASASPVTPAISPICNRKTSSYRGEQFSKMFSSVQKSTTNLPGEQFSKIFSSVYRGEQFSKMRSASQNPAMNRLERRRRRRDNGWYNSVSVDLKTVIRCNSLAGCVSASHSFGHSCFTRKSCF